MLKDTKSSLEDAVCLDFNQAGRHPYPLTFFPRYLINRLKFACQRTMPQARIFVDSGATQGSRELMFHESSVGHGGACKVLFLGDVMPVARTTQIRIDEQITDMIRQACKVVLNLETPVFEKACRKPMTVYPSFCLHIEDLKETLRAFCLEKPDYDRVIINLANNHAFDLGGDSIDQTRETLVRHGINNIIGIQPYNVFNLDAKTNICILAATLRLNPLAFAHRQGISKPDQVIDLLAKAPDTIMTIPKIGFIHWGYEYCEEPDSTTVHLARRLLTDMVQCEKKVTKLDMIIGHGAHLLQPVNLYGGNRICAFNLGDTLVKVERNIQWSKPRSLSGAMLVYLQKGKILGYSMKGIIQRHKKLSGNSTIELKCLPVDDKHVNTRFLQLFPD